MKRKLFGLLSLLCCALMAHAELPADAMLIEAESFDISKAKIWHVRPHFPNWYGSIPSGGKFLAGFRRKPGDKAFKTIKVAKAGKYNLHIRYMDVKLFPASFFVTISQNGKVIAEKEFDKVSLRSTPEGAKKYGTSFARFVWQKMEFTLPAAGKVDITLTTGKRGGTGSGSRHLDLFVLTQDLNYTPAINDLHPLYLQVRLLKNNPKPYTMHIFVRRSASPYYSHVSITSDGRKGLGGIRKKFYFNSGDTSQWVRIDDLLTYSFHNDTFRFTAMDNYYRNSIKYSEYELLFSRNKKDILYRVVRKGKGTSINVQICNAKSRFTDSLRESRGNLQRAKNAPPVPGKPGLDFPFFVSNRTLSSLDELPEVYENELQVRKILGANGSSGIPAIYDPAYPHLFGGGGYSHTNLNNCLQQVNYPYIEKHFTKLADSFNDYPGRIFCFMDEPQIPMEHFVKCSYCVAKFADFLKANNAGITGKPTMDKTKAKLYYWTGRYRSFAANNLVAAGTRELQKHNPHVRTCVNFGTETISGNMGRGGWDWFSVYNSGAMTFGWYEDWANLTNNYQVNGFMYDQMRGACRKNNVQFGIFNILGGRSDWDIQAKGFNAIGHGNKAMTFFNFGPHYAITSDVNSHRAEVYNAIRTLTHATGPVGKDIMASKVPRGEIAMLASPTHDIWHSAGKHPQPIYTANPCGKERVYLHLLLRHCGYRMDVLCEDDLFTELKHYKVLAVTDSHLRKDAANAILAWVKQGGTLLLTANAMTRSEFDEKLSLPFARQEVVINKMPGHAMQFHRGKNAATVAGKVPAKFGFQQPLNKTFAHGKGKIIHTGFFPGMSYHGSGKANRTESTANALQAESGVAFADGSGKTLVHTYDPVYRNYIRSLKLPVKPRISSNVFNVEANLLEAPDCYIIVLANFSGKPQKVTVTFDGKKYIRKIYAGEYIKIKK